MLKKIRKYDNNNRRKAMKYPHLIVAFDNGI
jgi:hypothetical protein